MHKMTIKERIIWTVVILASIAYAMNAYGQDTTRVWFSSPSGYEEILLRVPLSFEFMDSTSAIEGLLKFNDDRARYLGMEINHPSALAFDNHAGIDSVRWAISWQVGIMAYDTLLTFKFLPTALGSFMYNLSFLEFDERIPANDGITFVQGQTEIYPFDTYPGFVDTENYVEKSAACDWIVNFTILKDDAGDVTGNGDVSALDASEILRYTVGIIDVFAVEKDTIRTLPSFCDE